jgi:hypothetical protein
MHGVEHTRFDCGRHIDFCVHGAVLANRAGRVSSNVHGTVPGLIRAAQLSIGCSDTFDDADWKSREPVAHDFRYRRALLRGRVRRISSLKHYRMVAGCRASVDAKNSSRNGIPRLEIKDCIHDFRYLSHGTHRMERSKERMDFGHVHGGLDNSRRDGVHAHAIFAICDGEGFFVAGSTRL